MSGKVSDSQVSKTNGHGSQVALSQPERLVKLKDLHGSDHVNQPGDYIQVKVLWRSKFPPSGSNQPCSFILADNTDHIAAVMFVRENDINHKNAYKIMKSESTDIVRIKNFKVRNDREEKFQIIKYQTKDLLLSGSTRDLMVVDDENVLASMGHGADYFQYIPAKFTSLNKVDNCPNDSFVDVIGYVKDISGLFNSKKNETVVYQKVLLSTCSRDLSEEANDEDFEKYATLFEGHFGKIKDIDTVYALLNVKVDVFDYENSTSLKTTWCTIAFEITAENMDTLLPPNSLSPQQKQKLFFENSERTCPQSQPIRVTLPCVANPSGSAGPSKRTLSPNSEFVPNKKPKSEPGKANPPHNTNEESSDEDETEEELPLKIYDFVKEYKPLEVKVTTAKKFKGDRKKAYTMRSKRRGIALIINNYYYPQMKHYIRKGSNLDVIYLLEFLKSCNFEVIIKDNVESKNLSSVIAEFKKEAQHDMDACFVAVLSHGVQGAIKMVDQVLVPLHNDIVYQFDDLNFPIFKGKPKIFVIQACQTLPEEGMEETSTIMQSSMSTSSSGKIELDDTIVCFATIPEVVAQRDIFLGSHYVYVLVDTLMDYAHNRDFITILNQVRKRLKKIKRGKKTTSLNCGFNNYGVSKKIYFNPGL